jgi:predicted XRE-type DNA-binding protein
MRGKHGKIELSQETRKKLEKFCTTGNHSVKSVIRAKIILELDESNERKPLKQEAIADKIGVSRQAVNDAKKAFFASESVSEFLKRKKRETPPIAPKMTGELEAHIIAKIFICTMLFLVFISIYQFQCRALNLCIWSFYTDRIIVHIKIFGKYFYARSSNHEDQ